MSLTSTITRTAPFPELKDSTALKSQDPLRQQQKEIRLNVLPKLSTSPSRRSVLGSCVGPNTDGDRVCSVRPPDVEPPLSASDEIPTPPLAKEVKIKLLSCCLCFLVAGLNDGSTGALIPYLIAEYDISTGFVSVVYATSFAGWATAAMVMGLARAYAGINGTLLIGAILYVLAQVLRVWTPPYPLFALSFFVASLGQAFQDAQANTFVSSISASHLWLGIIHAMYGLGLLVAPITATVIASRAPARWAIYYAIPLGVGVLNVILVLAAFFPVRRLTRRKFGTFRVASDGVEETPTPIAETGTPQVGESSRHKLANVKMEMMETVKLKSVWLISLFFFFYLGTAITIGGWTVLFLTSVRNLPLSSAGYVPTGYYGGVFLGRLFLAGPTHTLLGGEHYTLTLYSIIIAALQLVAWLVDSAIITSVAISLMGLLLGPFFAAAVQVASEVLPRKVRANALGIIFVIAQLGGSVFPGLTGAIAVWKGVGVLQPITLVLILATAVSWFFVPTVPRGTVSERE